MALLTVAPGTGGLLWHCLLWHLVQGTDENFLNKMDEHFGAGKNAFFKRDKVRTATHDVGCTAYDVQLTTYNLQLTTRDSRLNTTLYV